MADSINVFIDAPAGLKGVVDEVGKLLELDFEHQRNEYEEWYATRTDEGLFTIGTHDFDGDETMNLQKYKYEVAFWVNRDKEPNERERLQRDVGKRIFEKLKNTRKYPLMYVFDVQQKLDAYHP